MSDDRDGLTTTEPDFVGEPGPEDFLPSQPSKPSRFARMPPSGSIVPGAWLVAFMTIASIASWTRPEAFDLFYVSKASIVYDKEYWRVFTAILGHGDLQHLLHNLPVFIFFAWILQGYFGPLASLVLPLLVGAISNAVTIYFYGDDVRLLGASGMTYGMVALWLTLYVRFDREQWWAKKIMRSIGFSLLVLIPQTYDPKVSYLAHFSGFLCGLFLGRLSWPIFERIAPVLKEEEAE